MNLSHYEIPTEYALQEAMAIAINQITHDLHVFDGKFKIDGSTDNFYEPKDNISWTSGFWTGQIWIAYEMTGDERYKLEGFKHVDSFLQRIIEEVEINHHDMGFLYSLSCVAAYKLTENEKAKKAAIYAAEHLISRYQEKGGFIQAWGDIGADDNYRLIIDCLLNLLLLYWASEVTGDRKYEEIATSHIDAALKVIMREDHSTYHTFYFDQKTGEPLYGETLQGYSNESAWARGQAWGIYGTALAYMYTENELYKQKFYAITDYFINHLPKDLVPYWDFCFDDGSVEPKDSSAAAIAVCGMLEMIKHLKPDEGARYKDAAMKILKSLMDNYAAKDPKISNGVLLHGVYCKSSPFNPCKDNNVDECNPWGDYYYMEALIRTLKDWDLYW